MSVSVGSQTAANDAFFSNKSRAFTVLAGDLRSVLGLLRLLGSNVSIERSRLWCVPVDAVMELVSVSALPVSLFPQLIFTKAGKILYCERCIAAKGDEYAEYEKFAKYYFSLCPAYSPPLTATATASVKEDVV